MVKIIVKNSIIAKDVPSIVMEKSIKDLTFKNPVFEEAKKHNRFISMNTEPELRFYLQEKNKIRFPKGYLFFFKRTLDKYGYKYEIEDKTLKLDKIDFEFNGTLRDYQAEAVKDCLSYPCAVLEASTGSGKTVMGIYMVVKRKQPTIIIVHTKELLHQWRERIKQFMGIESGVIGDGKYDVQPVTVAIINSLKNNIDNVKDLFGHVILDEVHRCPSNMWVETLKEFPAKFTLGLSATPYRRDGLGTAIYAFIGPKMHKVNAQRLRDEGAVLKPQIIRIPTNFRYFTKDNKAVNYSAMVSSLTKNRERNRLIAKVIKNDWDLNKDNILVVSDRVVHCKLIQEELSLLNVKSALVHGSIKQADRKKIIKDVMDGKVKVLIATLSLIGEGFDCPNLTSLFITTPIKFSGRLIQTIGRILRPGKEKKPRVYDFVDNKVSTLRYSGYARNRIYKNEWGT